MSPWLLSADEIGRVLGISGRHVRRYAEQGLLPTIQPGRHDIAWMASLRVGEEVARKLNLDRLDGVTLAALGRDRSWSTGDTALFVAMAERNGLARDAAMQAKGFAKAVRK